MTRYRIFLFDRQNHFTGIRFVTSLTDDDALAHAATLVTDQRRAEVWERARVVGKLAPESSQSDPRAQAAD